VKPGRAQNAKRANCRLNEPKYFPPKNRFALSISLIPANLNSLTSWSCSTPFIRSTRPLACGLLARISSTPKASIERPNCVCDAFPASCPAMLATPSQR